LPTLLEIGEAIQKAAGWSRPLAENDGALEFELLDDLSFKLIVKGGRLAAFFADLGHWPEEETEADDLARRLGKLATGTFTGRKAIVSIASGRLSLHQPFDLNSIKLAEAPELCEGFLNDLAFWRANVEPQ
jgi:hypothetical protein